MNGVTSTQVDARSNGSRAKQSQNASSVVSGFLDIAKLDAVLSDVLHHGQVNHEMHSDERYYTLMSPWRAAIRRRLVKNLPRESACLARMQNYLRSPWLDVYFRYTSFLGTHTFFVTALPALFFFGYTEVAFSLLFTLGLGVYFVCLVKDLVCSPRPLSPPVTRMSLGAHHFEYGYPSTHAANCMSIALYLFTNIHNAFNKPDSMISTTTYAASSFALSVYVVSIVFGRMYTGMHSISDCTMGALIGTLIWAVENWFGDTITSLVIQPGWTSPITLTLIGLLLVYKRPQPVEDCPCFEDAIACVSAVLGSLLARWHIMQTGNTAEILSTGLQNSGTRWTFAMLKLVIGMSIIFIWRLLAKSVLNVILPPIFRLFSKVVGSPSEQSRMGPSQVKVKVETCASGLLVGIDQGHLLKTRNGAKSSENAHHQNGNAANGFVTKAVDNSASTAIVGPVKHSNVFVLTKVVVYAGISVLAVEGIPVLFQKIGWGGHP